MSPDYCSRITAETEDRVITIIVVARLLTLAFKACKGVSTYLFTHENSL